VRGVEIGGVDLAEALGPERQVLISQRIRRDIEVVGDEQGAGELRVERASAFPRVGLEGRDIDERGDVAAGGDGGVRDDRAAQECPASTTGPGIRSMIPAR
jgi:hypothetical protein